MQCSATALTLESSYSFRWAWTVCTVQAGREEHRVMGNLCLSLTPSAMLQNAAFFPQIPMITRAAPPLNGKQTYYWCEPWIPAPSIRLRPPFELKNVFACHTFEAQPPHTETQKILNVYFLYSSKSALYQDKAINQKIRAKNKMWSIFSLFRNLKVQNVYIFV